MDIFQGYILVSYKKFLLLYNFKKIIFEDSLYRNRLLDQETIFQAYKYVYINIYYINL